MHKALAIPQPWGRRSRSWMVLCLCALKFMDPFSFAVPKKQLGSQMQRQKDGLLVHTPVDGSLNSAINYPGVTIEVTTEEKRLASQLQGGEVVGRRWSSYFQSTLIRYSPMVFTAAMQAALKCRRYLEGAKMFETLRDVEAPKRPTSISAPAGFECNVFVCIPSFCGYIVAFAFKPSKHSQREQLQSSLPQFEMYVNAMKLYGKLDQESPVRELWAELQRPLPWLAPIGAPLELAKAVARSHETNVLLQTHSVPTRLDLVDKIVAQARIDAAADNGDVDSAREVMAYMQKKQIEMNKLHLSSAINACANSNDKNRARNATDLFESMLDKGLKPNLVTYSSLVRSLKGSPSKDLLDALANMKVQGVKANKVFAENCCSFSWRNQAKVAGWRKMLLPLIFRS